MPDKVALELASQIANQNLAKNGWTTYYVDGNNGNDGANGLTWNSAFATIQYAVDIAESWATIYIKAGTYDEHITIETDNITIIGESRETTIIQPTDTGHVITVLSDNFFISNCQIVVSSTSVLGAAAICLGSYTTPYNEHATIKNCKMSAATSYGNGISSTEFNNVIIEGCIFDFATDNFCIFLAYSSYCKIFNNIITNVNAGGSAMRLAPSDDSLIYENLFKDSPNAFQVGGTSTGNNVFHNNFVDNGTDLLDYSSGTNKFWENYYNSYTTDLNNDGIGDSVYSFSGGIDYVPITIRDGWQRISLGFDRAYDSSKTLCIYPSLSAAILCTSSILAWTLGTYVQIVASNIITSDFYITGIVLNNLVIDTEYEVSIATGTSGSEVIIATVTHETHDTNLSTNISVYPPIRVSANTKISACCATENAAADTCTIKLMYKI